MTLLNEQVYYEHGATRLKGCLGGIRASRCRLVERVCWVAAACGCLAGGI
ncbi:hypothetical protein [Phormidesmis priestleyi]|nr:hypothetical protein [Phormidesmis priestleyi]